ncbi:MAG: DNA primase [Clostridiales bacterium]|nr:DNA primase [Clostridiales bacterium]
MAFVSDDLFNDICMANDIVDYASSFMTVKKSGKNYMACCPFHNEKTPSFSIDRDKQLFHCFGCGASGNFVQLVMRLEGLDYKDAVRQLAERANITIPETGVRELNAVTEKKELILEMNKIAARFFYDSLIDPKIGMEARRYFTSRKLSKETIIKFGLGYAPNSVDALLNLLKSRGYKEKDIVDAGLAVMRNGKAIDKYRNRVIFPIINVRGKVIGFGGRVMGSNELADGTKIAKYLNSPQTLVYDKSSNVFALNIAKNSNEKSLILCEGYMDVISVHQAGITNCVATLGTALTEQQTKLLNRYCNEVLICYDMDEAGTKAALRAIDMISSAGGKSRVIRITGAKDPDEYISKYGVSGFRTAIEKAMPSTAFKLSLIRQKYDIADTDGKIQFVDEAAMCLATLNNPVEVEAYIKKTASETGISERAISAKYIEHKSKVKKPRPDRTKEEYKRREVNRLNSEKPKSERVGATVIDAERKLLSIISKSRRLCIRASELIEPEEFSNSIYTTLATRMYDCVKNGDTIDEAIILNEFSGNTDAENTAAAVFFNNEEYSDSDKTLYDLIYTIKLNKIEIKINSATDAGEIFDLIKQKNTLADERKKWQNIKSEGK